MPDEAGFEEEVKALSLASTNTIYMLYNNIYIYNYII